MGAGQFLAFGGAQYDGAIHWCPSATASLVGGAVLAPFLSVRHEAGSVARVLRAVMGADCAWIAGGMLAYGAVHLGPSLMASHMGGAVSARVLIGFVFNAGPFARMVRSVMCAEGALLGLAGAYGGIHVLPPVIA